MGAQLLGISMPQGEIEALLLEVDRSGRGELELEDFTQLMVLTLSKAAHAGDHAKAPGREQGGKPGMQQASLPFEVVALAYRRCAMPSRIQPDLSRLFAAARGTPA